jgi:hypothetical protein
VNFYQGAILALILLNAITLSLLVAGSRRTIAKHDRTIHDAHQEWLRVRHSLMRLWFWTTQAQREIFRDYDRATVLLGHARREIKRELGLLGVEQPLRDLRPTPRQLAAELHRPYELPDDGRAFREIVDVVIDQSFKRRP